MSGPIVLNPASSVASIVVIGDSISEGTGATLVQRRWQQVLQAALRARIQPTTAAGAEVPYLSAWPRVSPMFAGYGRTATAGVTQAAFGLGLRAASVPAGDSVTFTFFGTRAKLLGTKGPAVGRYGIRRDGGAETVVDGLNSGSTLSGQVIWDSGTLPAGLHTVTVVRAASTTLSPGAVLPEGLMVYNGDTASGLRVVDSARHAAILASYTSSTAWHDAFAAIEGKQLLIMPWGANDSISGTTAAAFRTGVEQIIATARSRGFSGTVMLPKMPKRGSANAAVWSGYLAQLDAIAAADPNVVTVNVRSRIPDQGTTEAVKRGLYVDEAHFSDAGQKLIAQVLAEAILGDGWAGPDVLQVRVEAAFGANLFASSGSWSWTDLSSRLLAEPARIRAGKSGGAGSVSPSTCTVALLNDDGALTPKNPMSSYWPNIQRGTPLRVSVLCNGVWQERFAGFADQWQPTFLPATTPGDAHSAVRVTASGLLRRLEQGANPARSAPARYIPTTSPVAYWPLEDGELVSEGAALVGGQPMRPFVGTHPSGAVITFTQWGRGDLAPWLPQAVSRAGNHGLAIIWAPVSMPATGRWTVDFIYRSGTDAGDSVVDINPSYLPGGALGWPQLLLYPEFRAGDVSMNGEPEVGFASDALFDGKAHHVRWDVYQNAAKVSWNVYVDATMVGFGTTTANMTLPPMQTIGLTAGAQAGADMAQGHVAVWTSPPPVEDAVSAAQGHVGEWAANRIVRLCAEEGVSMSVVPGESEPMGPQPVAGLMQLLREAEEADMGVLFEQGFGLAYRRRPERYNPAVAMTIDMTAYRVARGGGRDVLVPAYDDQDLRNEWTLGRVGGQAPVTVLDAAHQARSGVYTDSADLNIDSDGRLPDHASWRVHLGTVDELREDSFPVDLAANPELVGGWLGCRVGSRIQRTNPPSQYGPGPLDTVIDGWTETISPTSWLAQVTPSPASAWDVAVVDGNQRTAADGSTLAADLTASGLSMLVSSAQQNGLWTQDPFDFPLEFRVGGERVIASAISAPPRLNATALFEGSISPWTSPDSTPLSVSTAQAHSGSSSMLLSPTGTTSMARAETEFMPATAGRRYTGFFWVRCSVARTIDIYVAGFTAGGSFLSSTIQSVSVAANTWVPISVTYTAPATTGQAKLGVRLTGTPPSTHTTWVDEAFFVDADQQTVTLSARGVNGVQRAWPAGTEVDVWQPAIVSL